MKEILYRGKVKKHPNMPKANWVFGDHLYLRASDKHYICDGTVWIGTLNPVKYEVDPETVGQYTGKADRNAENLFEHDLVYYFDSNHDEEDGAGQILWDEDSARFIIVFDGLTIDFDSCYSYELEKVGNAHDNPEMMVTKNENY